MANRLAQESSPYLLQHAENPVEWYPWGDEAFARARAEEKPLLLSVGYSACHWCHVMEHESFANEATAALMNEHFVCVKVDREERPDVEAVYMAATQAMSGSGGWPMTVFLSPDGRPFFAGTYFPPRDAYGRPGFPTLLQRIATAWEGDREQLLQRAESLTVALQRGQATEGGQADAPADAVASAVAHWRPRLRGCAQVPQPRGASHAVAPPPRQRRFPSARNGAGDVAWDGAGRHPRPLGGRLRALLGRRAVAGAAL